MLMSIYLNRGVDSRFGLTWQWYPAYRWSMVMTYQFLGILTQKRGPHYCNQMHETCVHSDDSNVKNSKNYFIQVKLVTRKEGELILKFNQISINHFIKLQVTSSRRKGPVPSGVFDETAQPFSSNHPLILWQHPTFDYHPRQNNPRQRYHPY